MCLVHTYREVEENNLKYKRYVSAANCSLVRSSHTYQCAYGTRGYMYMYAGKIKYISHIPI